MPVQKNWPKGFSPSWSSFPKRVQCKRKEHCQEAQDLRVVYGKGENMDNSTAAQGKTLESLPEDSNEVAVVAGILSQLRSLDSATRERIILTVATFFGVGVRATSSAIAQHASQSQTSTFSEDRSISSKQFMLEKQPKTDVEKVVCLAYYLTHYRDTPHFKTLDISKLNTEAAQVKFSNPSVALENAAKMNYLVPATKGNKQISALGEQFVQALPDRERAKAIMTSLRPRKRNRKSEPQSEEN
jgi:hypothetical protein